MHNRPQTWFERLVGFSEQSPQYVRKNLRVDGQTMTSTVNGRSFNCGMLETASLNSLRARIADHGRHQDRIQVRELIGDATALHADPSNAGALFQVASQFNLLEMPSPDVTPERGVGVYEFDKTQGPACAVAAGAGTIFRNYFVEINGHIGQSTRHQIDCLADLGDALGNRDQRLWKMKNGYALATRPGLEEVSAFIRASDEVERDALRGLLRIGIQSNTQVTLSGCTHRVNQAYCSALPVAYSDVEAPLWADFARLVLEASYEATLCAAVSNYEQFGQPRVFLTLVGGGAFGNATEWILSAMQRAIKKFQQVPLDLRIVSYRVSKEPLRKWLEQFK